MSKSGSPAARPMTGTPAWRSAVAWSVMAMVLDGRSALTRGLMVVSTASALTVAILAPHLRDSLALRIEETSTLQRRRRRRGRGRSAEAAKGTAAGQAAHLGNETEPVPVEVLVGRVKDGVEEEGAEREEKETIGAAALCWLVARWCEVAGPRSVLKWESDTASLHHVMLVLFIICR